LVTAVDIMGVIVLKDVRDKLIIYGGKYVGFLFACYHEQESTLFTISQSVILAMKLGIMVKNGVFCGGRGHDFL